MSRRWETNSEMGRVFTWKFSCSMNYNFVILSRSKVSQAKRQPDDGRKQKETAPHCHQSRLVLGHVMALHLLSSYHLPSSALFLHLLAWQWSISHLFTCMLSVSNTGLKMGRHLSTCSISCTIPRSCNEWRPLFGLRLGLPWYLDRRRLGQRDSHGSRADDTEASGTANVEIQARHCSSERMTSRLWPVPPSASTEHMKLPSVIVNSMDENRAHIRMQGVFFYMPHRVAQLNKC